MYIKKTDEKSYNDLVINFKRTFFITNNLFTEGTQLPGIFRTHKTELPKECPQMKNDGISNFNWVLFRLKIGVYRYLEILFHMIHREY